MDGEAEIIASLILASPTAVSRLSGLGPSVIRIELWHIVADIAGSRYVAASNDSPVPNINALADAVIPIIVAALGNAARTE